MLSPYTPLCTRRLYLDREQITFENIPTLFFILPIVVAVVVVVVEVVIVVVDSEFETNINLYLRVLIIAITNLDLSSHSSSRHCCLRNRYPRRKPTDQRCTCR